MPLNNSLEVIIGDRKIVVDDPEKINLGIDYKLEDPEDFQKKKGAEATSIRFPATLVNDLAGNTYHQPAIEDLTDGEVYRNIQPALIRANGFELLTGKAIFNEGSHTDKPEDYEYDILGDNQDWAIPLQETTLYDLLQHLNFTFTKQRVIDSWQYDGTNEQLPYVFAPVRYRQAMADNDSNMLPTYMRPSISKYWLIYWALKSQGYRIHSELFNTSFFRRQVMPWVWGNFLQSDGTRLSNLDFLAKSNEDTFLEGDYDIFVDVKAVNDSTDGAFDNNDCYSYNGAAKEMRWKYKPEFNYGTLDATFRTSTYIDTTVTANSDVSLRIVWYKNNVAQGEDMLVELDAPTIGRRDYIGVVDKSRTINVNPGDVITAKYYLHMFDTRTGRANIRVRVDAFELSYFRIPMGGVIDFQNYTALKKYKFLDFLRGVIDEFNLTIKTDTINKMVLMEPAHSYILPGETVARPGYFNGDFVEWSDKQDLSKKSFIQNFREFEREVTFRYKNDNADGLQKVIQDRYQNILAAAKYVLPERFKTGKKSVENRFFSPCMHYDVDQWQNITGTAPQMMALVPENISNTSQSESQNTFLPKSAYYQGIVNGWGWRFDGSNLSGFPFMFAVNYKPGGQNDPVLSYSDEKIGNSVSGFQLGQGLLKRFFLQRMAIMRNGQWYKTWVRLNNFDVQSAFHREYKICRSQRWELVEINNYLPLREESTQCLLRRWVPVAPVDNKATFPSIESTMEDKQQPGFDLRYFPLKCLINDIPK